MQTASAASKRRTVVDLRRDAAAWTQPSGSVGVLRLPLTIHIATQESGEPVVDHARVRRWVARANRELASAGIEVEVREVLLLPEGWSSITRWRQRRMLAAYAPRDGTIHVFVADELDSERRRTLRRRVRGLHWRYRGLDRELRAREYVMVTRGAPVTTFVHELGHLFGLPHSESEDNIMCSCRRGSSMAFTSAQALEMRHGVRRFEVRQSPSTGDVRVADRLRR